MEFGYLDSLNIRVLCRTEETFKEFFNASVQPENEIIREWEATLIDVRLNFLMNYEYVR